MTPPTIGELLKMHAVERPQKSVFTFLTFDGAEARQISYGELYQRACGVAASLTRLGLRQRPVLLAYDAGLEFAPAFFGTLLAGAIAVPAPLPRIPAHYQRLDRIAGDCQPGAVLSTEAEAAQLKARLPTDSPLRACPWLLTGGENQEASIDPEPASPSDLAVLQYTSGSTAGPRGVAVTHGNLAHNVRGIARAFQTPPGGRIVSWLPHFHDMGLVGGTLGPLMWGGECILMSPLAFLQRPLRWLEAISQYQVQVSGAPTFAYDLCARWADRAPLPPLDLSSWQTAFVGAEPVRFSTLQRFADRFQAQGFRPSALTPGYGMAEATLVVTCKPSGTMPTYHSLARASLLNHGLATPSAEPAALILTGCGRPLEDTQVRIVDPQSRLPLENRRVGEAWVAGPQVARGYWNEAGDNPFHARLADSGEGPFLRTGDLGFLTEEGEFVFVDRLKDLIIVNGQNYICHDVELAAGASHQLLSPDRCVAVSIESADKAHLVVIAELPAESLDCADEAAKAVRAGVFTTHGLPVHTIAFVPPRELSRTTSGKLQRRLTAKRLLSGALRVLARNGDPLPESPSLAGGYDTK
jgi:acyl-CoA synthetase (AMP-forming)/AMP-acid ligase II